METSFNLQGDSLGRQKNYGCFFQQILRQNVRWFFSSHRKTLPSKGFFLKPIERPYVPLKNGSSDFKIVLRLTLTSLGFFDIK